VLLLRVAQVQASPLPVPPLLLLLALLLAVRPWAPQLLVAPLVPLELVVAGREMALELVLMALVVLLEVLEVLEVVLKVAVQVVAVQVVAALAGDEVCEMHLQCTISDCDRHACMHATGSGQWLPGHCSGRQLHTVVASELCIHASAWVPIDAAWWLLDVLTAML